MPTTGVIGRAGTPLNIRLGESPNVEDPIVGVELQQVYNALHLLSNYMAALRENLESSDGQTPAESVRFRREFWNIAAQDIVQGAIVCSTFGGVYNGVMSKDPPIGSYSDSADSIGSTGNRTLFHAEQVTFGIAITAATAGSPVKVGIGPGVTQVADSKCGQLVWAADYKSIYTEGAVNTFPQSYSGVRTYVGNGGIYLANITTKYYAPNPSFTYYNWEGYWLPGYPTNSGGTLKYNRVFLYPIGVCIADGYVMFSDYKRSDPIPLRT